MNSILKQRSARRIVQDLFPTLRGVVMVLASFCFSACAPNSQTAQPEPASAFGPESSQSVEPVRSETVNRIYLRTCSNCHGPDGHGIAAVAPDLRRAKARSVAEWQQYLSNTAAGHPGAQMPPPTWLNVDEIEVMANYLGTLTQANATPAPTSATR